MSASRIGHDSLYLIDELQSQYARALDSQDMEGWLNCFADDESASYICISGENAERGLGVALMLDDCRARLKDRVTFVTQIWAGTFEPYRTRHFIQRLGRIEQSGEVFKLVSNFSIVATPEGGSSMQFAAGQYEDTVTVSNGEARFLGKRAVYDTTVLPRYIVYPF